MGRARGSAQLVLKGTAGHGGVREGAGRPRGAKARVPHRTRLPHPRSKPVHVTLRARRGVPSLRSERIRAMFVRLLASMHHHDFDVVHYSLQRDHVHLIVESTDNRALSSGMRSLAIRFAKRLNALLGRTKGKVWDHRYHRRDLGMPAEVKTALLYVLANAKKRGEAKADAPFVDPCSSAASFDGWSDHGRDRDGTDLQPRVVRRPRTWLLRIGWRRRGLLRTTDAPRVSPRRGR